jgi:phospholipid/cholesterol/gamma-HCH transport system permease protein
MEVTSVSTGATTNRSLEWFGDDLGGFSSKVIYAAFTRPFELREIIRQLYELGSKSVPLVALAGAAVVHVSSRHSAFDHPRDGAGRTGLVLCGRVGVGIGAELASMKVTEQIDAIEASAVNPHKPLT